LAVAAVAAVAVAQAHVQVGRAEAVTFLGPQERRATRLPQVRVVQAARPLISLGPLVAMVATWDRLARPARHLAALLEALAAPAEEWVQLAFQAMLATLGLQAPQ
jgi:hypothetical protein